MEAESLADIPNFLAGNAGPRQVTLLPDPEPAHRYVPIVSSDDHVVEPPDVFEGRVPLRYADDAPRVVERDDGREVWLWNGTTPNLGLNAVVGRPISEASFDPDRFDEMRRGAWDVEARVHDMDLNGIYASLNFPSGLGGFAGQRLQIGVDDVDLAWAVVHAWNDWHIEAWAAPHLDRIIPCQIPWLLDPVEGAEQIRANAARGFKAVAFTEAPEKLGLPSLHTGYWDPFMAACEETETVVCLHIGSASASPRTSSDAPPQTIGVLFFGYAMFSTVDWLFSQIPVRFPGIKICLSEGGIGWVPGLLDRLDHVARYQQIYGTWNGDLSPAEVLQRNFWFCAIEDPSTFVLRHRIGIENLLVESDYPHLDSTWPNTQQVVWDAIGAFPQDDIDRIAWSNAAALFRHPMPTEVQRDPNSFGEVRPHGHR